MVFQGVSPPCVAPHSWLSLQANSALTPGGFGLYQTITTCLAPEAISGCSAACSRPGSWLICGPFRSLTFISPPCTQIWTANWACTVIGAVCGMPKVMA